MVRAAQKGEMENPSPEVADVANDISVKDAKKFAKTKHKGLPEKKKMQEGISFTGWRKKASSIMKKTATEKKPQKAMDAGAKAKRLLQRKIHAKYVSGSTENVPDDIRDHYEVSEGKKKGLWDNIHAKRKRGERPARKGEKDYPKTLNVEHNDGSAKNCKEGEYFCNDDHKCKPIPKGYHVMPDGKLMKGEKHSVDEGAAWTKKAGKNKEGGLNEKGRKSYERENPGSDLKAPQPEGGSRKKSFCARMGGMKKKLTSSKTANDPDSRINKALRKWKC